MKNKLFFNAILFAGLTSFFFSCTSPEDIERPLPFLGNSDLEYTMVDGKEVVDTLYPKMIDFSFTNQDSIVVESKSFKGKVWIADFFFTSCPTICPKMTKQMKRLQEVLTDHQNQIQFLSFSINPKKDQPSVLKNYMSHHKITANNWQFLTGDLEFTNQLGIDHFLLFGHEDKSSAGGYAHSPSFSLVDQDGYIRGVYNGTEPEEVDRLAKDVLKLLK